MKNKNDELKKILSTNIWQANIKKAASELKKIPNSSLTPKYQKIKKEFLEMFIFNKEKDYFKTTDPFIIDLLKIYKKYWKLVLNEKLTYKDGEKFLARELGLFLKQHSVTSKYIKKINQLEEIVSKELGKRKINRILGKTLPFRGIQLWKKETRKIYTVNLFNMTKQKVTVIFMEDFITHGWADYASSGVSYPGGWAKEDAIYCVKKSYNIKSESFTVSYLTHEAQHFYDYIHFPKLKQIDLEYRTKLAEIFSSEKRLYDLLQRFIIRMKNDRAIPHYFANYSVIRNLSREISCANDIPKDLNV